ncbi:ABC transporter ATP-binding protein [Lutibaculum baratangense]|uniref:Oligopeptide transport ATP-binding protein OppD n=1 Tax=Lutibaculum baratangense AMV1 TaxID=631454 RepID=V4RHI6_9HYPH|nr:ABC transporter ATP-binding protein [Lutibaculum baratangense]ESR24814.1 Oligopeptide transport ATP-binding protein OppD [Lutibaculum baratangense AMV1]
MGLLDIRNLTVDFPSRRGTFTAVRDVALDVQRGEIHGLVGESGAGKSTIGNAIMGLLEPPGRIASGEIEIEGRRIESLPPEEMRKVRGKTVSMIFQDPLSSLNPLFTVERQLVETIREHNRMSEREAKAFAVDLLDQVGIPKPAERVAQYPHQFSGGMRQRVVIALALCSNPDLVIADEPTTALDVSIQAQILNLIRSLCTERNVGVILVTHDMGVIAETTDRVAVMYRGRIVERGATRKVLGDPDHEYTKSLVAAVPRPDVRLHRFPMVSYIEGPAREFEAIDLGKHWLGQGRRDASNDRHENLIELRNLEMDFETRRSIFPSRRRHFRAVDGVSLQIREGEIFGLVGESGSGKSTVARLISGLYTPTGGEILFDGTDIARLGASAERRPFQRQMQMIFQDPYSSLNPRMRVADIVAEPIRHHNLASGGAERRAVVEDLLEHVGLGREAARKYPHEFSGGQRQRISIARALATRPRFLICDEPTSALDVSIQAQILNLLKDLQEELRLTLLFISHDLPVMRQMCHRIGVMQNGRLCEVAETEDLFERPQHPHTQELVRLMPRLDYLSRRGLDMEPAHA